MAGKTSGNMDMITHKGRQILTERKLNGERRRQIEIQTVEQKTNRKVDKWTSRPMKMQLDGKMDRWTNRQMDIWIDEEVRGWSK